MWEQVGGRSVWASLKLQNSCCLLNQISSALSPSLPASLSAHRGRFVWAIDFCVVLVYSVYVIGVSSFSC